MVSMVPIGSARWHVVNLMKWYSVYMEQRGLRVAADSPG